MTSLSLPANSPITQIEWSCRLVPVDVMLPEASDESPLDGLASTPSIRADAPLATASSGTLAGMLAADGIEFVMANDPGA